jgi:hypothetical protein
MLPAFVPRFYLPKSALTSYFKEVIKVVYLVLLLGFVPCFYLPWLDLTSYFVEVITLAKFIVRSPKTILALVS